MIPLGIQLCLKNKTFQVSRRPPTVLVKRTRHESDGVTKHTMMMLWQAIYLSRLREARSLNFCVSEVDQVGLFAVASKFTVSLL
jgi:hypothetical protein